MTTAIELAKRCGIAYYLTPEGTTEMHGTDRQIEAFADMVSSEEREACAKEAERMVMYPGGRCEAPAHSNVWDAAKAIRARGK
jgi:hypothetical protein